MNIKLLSKINIPDRLQQKQGWGCCFASTATADDDDNFGG